MSGEKEQGTIMTNGLKVVKADKLTEPVEGTIRECLHAALDDLMNDLEKQGGPVTGGVTELHADAGDYRHQLILAVSVITELKSNPSNN